MVLVQSDPQREGVHRSGLLYDCDEAAAICAFVPYSIVSDNIMMTSGSCFAHGNVFAVFVLCTSDW